MELPSQNVVSLYCHDAIWTMAYALDQTIKGILGKIHVML